MSKWVILRVIMVTKAEHSKLRNKYILYGFATFFVLDLFTLWRAQFSYIFLQDQSNPPIHEKPKDSPARRVTWLAGSPFFRWYETIKPCASARGSGILQWRAKGSTFFPHINACKVFISTVWPLKCFFFFSDARNMARDVHNLLVTIVKENGGMTENEAADYVKKLSAKGRYSVDVWS